MILIGSVASVLVRRSNIFVQLVLLSSNSN